MFRNPAIFIKSFFKGLYEGFSENKAEVLLALGVAGFGSTVAYWRHNKKDSVIDMKTSADEPSSDRLGYDPMGGDTKFSDKILNERSMNLEKTIG